MTQIRRPVQPSPKPHRFGAPRQIFLTGGIGDVIALESYFRPDERENLQTIYYASRKNAAIMEIMQRAQFPATVQHIALWDDFDTNWCFHRKRDYFTAASQARKHIPYGAIMAEDWGILLKFQQIHARRRVYSGSTLLRDEIQPDLSRFNLPSHYFVLCPFSNDKRNPERDMTRKEISLAYMFASVYGTGVLLNEGDDVIESHPNIRNLANQTTLAEAIAILKGAKGYIGVDSCLSTLAPKCFAPERILIKSTNVHLYKHAGIYYAPATNMSFLVRDIATAIRRFAEIWTPLSKLPPSFATMATSSLPDEA